MKQIRFVYASGTVEVREMPDDLPLLVPIPKPIIGSILEGADPYELVPVSESHFLFVRDLHGYHEIPLGEWVNIAMDQLRA